MVFAPGPIFANIVLADEINRTPPKTQAALLEAMQEYHVTAAGRTHTVGLTVNFDFTKAASLKVPVVGSLSGVQIAGGGPPAMAGATVTVERGQVVSSTPALREEVDAWASASAIDWLDTLVEPPLARVETGGSKQLAASLLAGLHERLFRI